MTNDTQGKKRQAEIAAAAAELANGACLIPDVATAGQPREDQFRRLADAGIRTVIDLRPPAEPRGFDEVAAVRDAGVRYVNIPVTAQTLGDGDFDRVRALLNDPANRPALLHCASANRVGAVLLPYLMLDAGMSEDDALELAHKVGLRSTEMKEAALRYSTERAHG